jgi:hypothetical protein
MQLTFDPQFSQTPLLNDEQSLNIQRSGDVLKSRVRFMKLMLHSREETMQRCNPENTKLAMENFAKARCGVVRSLSMTSSMILTMSGAIINEANDLAVLHAMLDMCKHHQTQLRKEEQRFETLMSQYLVQMKEDQVSYDMARQEAEVLRPLIALLEHEIHEGNRSSFNQRKLEILFDLISSNLTSDGLLELYEAIERAGSPPAEARGHMEPL